MTKIFITVILFLLALAVVALDQRDFENILKQGSMNLAYGVTMPESKPAWDFSDLKKSAVPSQSYMVVDDTMPGYENPYKAWYDTDFAEDPFDGLIEVYVVGEPLPSPIMTLVLALGTCGIIYSTRKRRVVV
jgi:hypothetical protein